MNQAILIHPPSSARFSLKPQPPERLLDELWWCQSPHRPDESYLRGTETAEPHVLLDTPDWKQCYPRSQTGVPFSFLTYPAATSPQYVRELRCLPSYKPSTRTAEALPHWLWGSSIHLWVLLSNTLCQWFQHSLIWKNDTPWDFILSYKGKLLLTFSLVCYCLSTKSCVNSQL